MSERVFYEGAPDSAIVMKWIVAKLIPLTLTIGFVWTIIVVFVTIFSDEFEGFFTTVFLGIVMIVVFVFFYLNILKTTYKYKITEKGVYFASGVVNKTQKFVPFHKITNVVVSQDILEIALGISSINIQTEGTGGYGRPEIVFEGLAYLERPNMILEECIDSVQNVSDRLKNMPIFEDLDFDETENSIIEEWPEEELVLEWEEIEKEVPLKRYTRSENRPDQKDETLKELFGKWKRGEISTEEYFKEKQRLGK